MFHSLQGWKAPGCSQSSSTPGMRWKATFPSPPAAPGPPPRYKHDFNSAFPTLQLGGVSHFSQKPAVPCGTARKPWLCLESAGSGLVPWMNLSVKPVELQCWRSLGKAGMGCSCWKTPSPSKCHEHHNSQTQNAALTLSPPCPAPQEPCRQTDCSKVETNISNFSTSISKLSTNELQ